MISLRSGLCILASTGVSLQKVVPLGIHTNVNTYAAVSYLLELEPILNSILFPIDKQQGQRGCESGAKPHHLEMEN